MQPELAARLSNIARGNFAQKTTVTAVTPVTGLLVTAKKPGVTAVTAVTGRKRQNPEKMFLSL